MPLKPYIIVNERNSLKFILFKLPVQDTKVFCDLDNIIFYKPQKTVIQGQQMIENM